MAEWVENLRHRKAALAAVEVLLALIVILALTASTDKATAQPGVSDMDIRYEVKIKYPFHDLIGYYLGKDAPPDNYTVFVDSSVISTSQLLLATGIICIVISVIRLVLYAALGEHPKSQRVPPAELVATSFMTLMLVVSASMFVWQVSDTLISNISANLDVVIGTCPTEMKCYKSLPRFRALYAAGAFQFISAVAWAINIWFAFRNTYLHRPYYLDQMEAGQGPGAQEIPTTSTPATSYGTGEGRSSKRFNPGKQWEPKEMSVMSKPTAADMDA
ncbi:uncharacterized protein LOC135824199 [Sycon ciliatum]|uniref:uncharacterized protein LOC135824199 n=1 Tax=Sycon ciliatum TaxID=27933 RepID=UPI0020AD6E55|eukprot:scpid62866/ scgid13203/ Synaptophysin; Major synaptic vesicle protein p38